MVNSWKSHFSAACSRRRPFSRSYGAILPSSLTKVLSFPLVYSTHLPVSVCGTGSWFHRIAAFLGILDHSLLALRHRRHGSHRLQPQSNKRLSYQHASLLCSTAGSGILTGCPSTTPFGLALGPTNPTRTDLPSETLGFRGIWFSHISRYSSQHSHLCWPHVSSRLRLYLQHNALLPFFRIRSFGG